MTEDLEKIDEMFEMIWQKSQSDPSYDNYKTFQDIIDIWDYVREKLNKPKFQRFVEVEELQKKL